jgi:hypothetical protein
MPEESREPLLAYLREHSSRYSLEALRAQLIEAGHAPEVADQTVAAFRQEQSQRTGTGERSAWPIAIGVALLDFAVPGGILAVLAVLEASEGLALLGIIPPLLYVGELIGGLVLLATGGNRRLGKGLLFGLALFVGVSILAVGGLCLFFLTQTNIR